MDTDATNGDSEQPKKTRKVKKQVRKGDLPISAGTASLSNELREQYFEQEGNMQSEDKLVAETEDKKNELEGDIYALRNKVDEPYEQNGYSEFASEEEKEKIKAKCEALEVCSISRLYYCLNKQNANKFSRTGFTTTARTPPRHSTSASTRSSVAPPPPSSSASTSAASRKRTSAAPRLRPRPRSSARPRRRRGRPMLRPRLPPTPQRGWPTSAPHKRPLRSLTRR